MRKRIVIIFTCFIVILLSCRTHFKTQEIAYPVTADAAQLKDGKKMVVSICGSCHYDMATGKLTGKQMHDLPGISGKVYSRNITQDPVNGIGNYTNGELVYLIRTGIARDGRLMSYMQRPNLADTDLQAIIAFLRSDDPLVTPSPVEPPQTHYTAIGKFGINHFPGPLPYTGKVIAKPNVNDKIAYGKYLVDNLSCYHCHSISFLKVNELEPEKSKGYMGGGNKLKNKEGKIIRSANITFDETGIAGWTETDFVKAVKEGVNTKGYHLRPPMPAYKELDDADVSAIYAYLRSIPKIKNEVDRK
jgi:mono/diheme cytochrome c family protein